MWLLFLRQGARDDLPHSGADRAPRPWRLAPLKQGGSVTDDDAWWLSLRGMQFFDTPQAHRLGLVVRAEESHPIPSRTRKLSPPAPMVLRRRRRERVGRCQSLISDESPDAYTASGLSAFLAWFFIQVAHARHSDTALPRANDVATLRDHWLFAQWFCAFFAMLFLIPTAYVRSC